MITSRQNVRLTLLQQLGHAAGRKRHGLWRAEGPHLVEAALSAGHQPEFALLDAGQADLGSIRALVDRLRDRAVPLYRAPSNLFRLCNEAATPQAIVAAVPRPPDRGAAVFERRGVCVILDRLQDPVNVGAVVRSASAFDACGAVLLKGCADCGHPRALRASAGTAWTLPMWSGVDQTTLFAAARQAGRHLVTAEGDAPAAAEPSCFAEPCALVVGNESAGVSTYWRRHAQRRIRIPMPGEAQSLNVAVAAGILCYLAAQARAEA